ncbi:Signal transduction histidine kinase [Dyadobacter sp. SG02]|uniref:hybrid sensor histidine kinase/response regulator transcription factor n=1 Tax=Dyadobacter sp. SG02 TaxID=1855291 RepID=UPI0008C1DEB7|nr:two-component regulator propeller domain-containing protein [Dyadobacter sp. SG02]SEJ37407.1 Signal transduction histidine kinase [Dyadobacter sp. SG02]
MLDNHQNNSALPSFSKLCIAVYLFIVGAMAAPAQDARGQSFPYSFKYLTVDEGLSHTDVNDIVQDGKGYIWVATNFGLDRNDGYAMRKFYNRNRPLHNAFKNRIIRLFPDKKGVIWLSTEDGLQSFDPAVEKYTDYTVGRTGKSLVSWKHYKTDTDLLYIFADYQVSLYRVSGNILEKQALSVPPDVHFSDMEADRHGVLYFASNKGIWRLDGERKLTRVLVPGLPNDVKALFFDLKNNLLAASGKSAFLIDGKNPARIKTQFTCEGCANIRGIAAGTTGDYWLNTGSSLTRLSADFHLVQKIDQDETPRGLNSNAVSRVFIDRSDCLWVGTAGGGLNYCDLNQKRFYTIRHEPGDEQSITGNYIRAIIEDGDNLWIGTDAHGLNLLERKSGRVVARYGTGSQGTMLTNNSITALNFDRDDNLWIGTSGGIQVLRRDRKTLWKPDGSEKFPTYSIVTLATDYFGNIWFGNLEHLGVIWKDAAGKYQVKEYPEGNFILAEQQKPELLVGSRQGLKHMTIDAQGNILKQDLYRASDKPNSLSSDYTAVIKKQNDSTYWVGTIGGGLNRLTVRKSDHSFHFAHFGEKDGVFNDVEGIEVDNQGGVWLAGNGLLRLAPNTDKVTRYDKDDGLQGNSFKIRSSFASKDGTLYFGGINGLNYFHPGQIRTNAIEARPALTGILINNRRPEYRDAKNVGNVIDHAAGYGEDLTLNYLQNNFVVTFSAMHFANPLKCRYRYKLIGFDQQWNYTDGGNPGAVYSNLNYGQYKFIVEATNSDGTWSTHPATTLITITPPWWKSDLAKFIYALLLISMLAGIYIYQARWYRLKREVEVRAIAEQKREEIHRQREELYQQQLLFFTNISHEFRTPLSLILGPLEALISQNSNTVLDHSYQLMHRNAKRLINLISELMNFKKVSDSLIKLQVAPVTISQFCQQLVDEFQLVAFGKSITLTLVDHAQKSTYWPLTGLFDVQVLEKILLNLLNNSFKFTEPGGEITLEIFTDINKFKPSFEQGFELLHETHRADKYLYFRIADTGVGIPSDTISRIFERYYRISRDHMGSGVGLALVKSLTQLHKGDIYVYSEHYKGTEIIIGIPLGEQNWTQAERAPSKSEPHVRLEAIDNSTLLPIADPTHAQQKPSPSTRKRILLVDDNAELRIFLKQKLEKQYFVYEASDGDAAMKLAADKIPDLIISDIMMPGISGIDLCRQVKERFETSHIPFIILSAKDALDSKIEGMESGADFYFAKPLSVDLLMLTVNNIFDQREKLQQKFTNNYLSQATELVHSEKDKAFFESLLKVIEDHMQEPELDVDFLCKNLYVSRTKLYQKIKSITDQSVGDFIRTIRLKKAIEIMTHEDIALNKVVERVGLQSSSNFSRVFKKEYGKSPLQFMQALKRNES